MLKPLHNHANDMSLTISPGPLIRISSGVPCFVGIYITFPTAIVIDLSAHNTMHSEQNSHFPVVFGETKIEHILMQI